MNIAQIDVAIAEAKRFIEQAKACRAAKIARYQAYPTNFQEQSKPDHAHCPREQGALRRASMDLTRALADLRKPS